MGTENLPVRSADNEKNGKVGEDRAVSTVGELVNSGAVRWKAPGTVFPDRKHSSSSFSFRRPSRSQSHSELTVQRLSLSSSQHQDDSETLNLFESPERLRIIVVRNMPTFWTMQATLKVLQRFGAVEAYDKTLDSRKKRALIVKFDTPQSAMHALISLATRGVGFNSKKLDIQYPRGVFLDHPMLMNTDSMEHKEMRDDIERTLQPMFSMLLFLGVPNHSVLSLRKHGPFVRNFFLGYFYPFFVSSIMLYCAIKLAGIEAYHAYIEGDSDFAILVITCGVFFQVCFFIHIHHCRQMSKPFSTLGLIPLIQYTVRTVESLDYVSETIEREALRLTPRVVGVTVLSCTFFFLASYETKWTLFDRTIIPLGAYYAIGAAMLTFVRIRLYSRVVESGFRAKVRDLLVGDASVSQIKKQYILVSLLTQEAISREQPMLVWMTTSLLFSTVLIAANMFIVAGMWNYTNEPLELICGFVFNVLNELWWFLTMYEGTRATDSFKDLLENLRGPLYVTDTIGDDTHINHSNHIDLDAYVPGIKIFGQVLDTRFLALAARVNASALAVVAFRSFLSNFSSTSSLDTISNSTVLPLLSKLP